MASITTSASGMASAAPPAMRGWKLVSIAIVACSGSPAAKASVLRPEGDHSIGSCPAVERYAAAPQAAEPAPRILTRIVRAPFLGLVEEGRSSHRLNASGPW